MSGPAKSLREECARALEAYLAKVDETTRLGAYALGRRALAERVGLLEFVGMVHGALVEAIGGAGTTPEAARTAAAAEGFLLECFSPFEMALRGSHEVTDALRRQNELLEEETRRIAHEVHDSAGQILAAVHMELQQAAMTAPLELRPRFHQVEALLDKVEADLRRLSHELRPTILDDLGLLPALRLLAEGVSNRTGLAISVQGSSGDRLPPKVEIALYRIAQEALANAAKHAQASHAEVRIERSQGEICCIVWDDGAGFDPAQVLATGGQRGLGLIGIRERLASLGGSLSCDARKSGRGTLLIATVPLETKYVA